MPAEKFTPKIWFSLIIVVLLFVSIFFTQLATVANRDNRGKASGGVNLDYFSTGSSNTATSTLGFNATVGSSANRLLVVGVTMRKAGGVSVANMNFGGADFSPILSADQGGVRTEMWYLNNPASGTKTLTINFNGTPYAIIAGAESWSGVDNSRPIGSAAGNSGFSTNPNLNIGSNSGEVVLDTVGLPNLSTDTISPEPSQTLLWNVWSGVNSQERGGASTKAGASSVTMSWTTKYEAWAIIAVSIRPVPSPTPSPSPPPSPSPSPKKPSPPPSPSPGVNANININLTKNSFLQGKDSVTFSVDGTGITSTNAIDSGATLVTLNGNGLALNSSYNLRITAKNTLTKVVGFKFVSGTSINVDQLVVGDVAGDNVVDGKDLDLLLSKGIGPQDKNYDLNMDGVVNSVDYALLLSNLGKKGS